MQQAKNSAAADPTTDRTATPLDPDAPQNATAPTVSSRSDRPALRPDAPTAHDAIMCAAGPGAVPLAVVPEAFAAVGPFLFGHGRGSEHEPATRPRIDWREPTPRQRAAAVLECELTGDRFTPDPRRHGPACVPYLVFDLSGRDGANEYRIHPVLATAGLPAVAGALRHKVWGILDDLAAELSPLHWFAEMALQIEAAAAR